MEAAVWLSVFSTVGGARLPWLTLFVRRRCVRPKASIVFACLLLIAACGCVPLNYGVFISTLDEDVTLEVRNLQVNGFGSARRFKVSQGQCFVRGKLVMC